MLTPILKEEVRRAVFSMKSYKAPGPDGFQPIFFKHFWDTIGDDLWHLVQMAFSTGSINESIAETLLVLIPKETQPQRLKNFRPISLCNVIFKVVTKVLVNRLRPFLDDLISPLQGSFIPGRGTTDNAILAQEVVHHMHHSKSKKGSIVFKIDLEKAYDRLNWKFLEITLIDFGIPPSIISLIISCVRSSNLAVLWNGARTNNFRPSRGLRQGDPLSPYLFVLCMEKLSLSIQQKVNDGTWKPIQISKGGPSLSHILFADDVMLFCEANVEQVQVVMSTLDDFCTASGLKVNTLKSKAMCSRMVQVDRKHALKEVSDIRFVADLGHYLGFPLVKGRVSKDVYNDILDRVQKKLASWKGNLLNKAGRACLVKSVTTAIPVYTMQLHHIPTNVCNQLDKIARSFLWGGDGVSRTWNHVNWHTVTTPKRFGGLGIREARIINVSLLGKLVWSMLHHKEKLWVQVLTHKYLDKKSIWIADKKSSASITWRGIMKAVASFAHGYKLRIGAGETSFWYEDWTKLGPLCKLVHFVNISDTELKLHDVCKDGGWDLQILATMMSSDIVQAIQQITPPMILDTRLNDEWAWQPEQQGKYTCSSGYFWLLQQQRGWDPNCDMRWIWRLKVPAKIQHFIWLCSHNALPTNARRHYCNMAASPGCTRCSSLMEDHLHCLRDCPHSKELWLRLGMGGQRDFFSLTETTTWVKQMACGTLSLLFLAGLWKAWCWRNNSIFEEQPCQIHEVVRKTQALHDEFITFCQPTGSNTSMARILVHWKPPPEGLIKLNVDGSFLEDGFRLGAGGVLRGHEGNWIAGFTHFGNGGDALLAELRAIQLGIATCYDLGYTHFICESDCLEAIDLILNVTNASLHVYASVLLEISDALHHGTINLVHIPREQNICADFMAKKGAHSASSAHWDRPPDGLESLLLRDKLAM
jgi:hypothetical protein